MGKHRRKGVGPTYDMSMIIVEVVMIVIFTVMLFQAVKSAFNPDLQVAVLNTELLRSKINQACLTGKSELNKFTLPQAAPNKLLSVADAFPKFAILSSGDPNFVLYYESFPLGEGIGWEIYQGFPARNIAPFDYSKFTNLPDESVSVLDFQNELTDRASGSFIQIAQSDIEGKIASGEFFKDNEYLTKDMAEALVTSNYVDILIPNILLDDNLGAITSGYLVDKNGNGATYSSMDLESPGPLKIQPLGEWVTKNGDGTVFNGDNRYVFSNYNSGLNNLEKSFIKYRSCGDNSLCLKTRDSVYRFKLDDSCDIKYIQIEYDATNKWKFYVPAFIGVAAAAIAGPVVLGSAGAATASEGISFLGTVAKLGRFGLWIAKTPLGKLGIFTGGLISIHKIGAWLVGIFLTYKKTDVYFASPCTIESDGESAIEIEKVSCTDMCSKMIKYPIYSYNPDMSSVGKLGYTYACVENAGDSETGPQFERGDNCIKIKIKTKPKDYCWTANPWKDGFFDDDTRKFAEFADALPIRQNTEVITGSTYVSGSKATYFFILPSKLIDAGDKLLKAYFDVDWRWPNGFSAPS